MFAPAFDFDVRSGSGLAVEAGGIPLVRGSWFQYYAPGWTAGYYSSGGNTQKVTRVDANTVNLEFVSGDGRAHGSQTYRKEGDRLIIDYRFQWEGAEPARIEVGVGQIWAPVFRSGSISADGQPTRPTGMTNYPPEGIEARVYGGPAKSFALKAPLVDLQVDASQPLTLFDARGYDQPWAQGRSLLWLGAQEIEVAKDRPATLHVEWRIGAEPAPTAKPLAVKLASMAVKDALVPETRMPVLIPKPKKDGLVWDKPLTLSGNWSFPVGRFRGFDEFDAALRRRFRLPAPSGAAIAIDGGTAKLGLRPGGYRLLITPTKISVIGQEDEGLRYGLHRLAQLAFVKDGKLQLPTGFLLDEPVRDFRGVHLFVGPEAIPFQKRLWDRVLFPLGFNEVVLQCERTAWQSLPGIETSQTMKREDLARLFAMYRKMNVDPIPLIQSFGHMEWLFANGKNRDLAFNPDVLYAIDPRKPEAQAVLKRLWDEAAALLKPSRMHFGLDEVNMRGFPDDAELVTQIWEAHLPFLGGIAKAHDAKMMLWGDQALAPGEGPDASLGVDGPTAARRRRAIPRGAEIADWHYKAEPSPAPFTRVLQLWKNEGLRPIASTWYPLANIRGFGLAADIEGSGTLQTTWAGYESNETNMLQNIRQFTAMVYAADMAWSARSDELPNLPYRPEEVFRRMMYGSPKPVVSGPGMLIGSGESTTADGIRFRLMKAIGLGTVLDPGSRTSEAKISLSASGSETALLVDTQETLDDGEPVAEATISFADGKSVKSTLRYGWDVRATDDPAPTVRTARDGNVSVVRISHGGIRKIQSVTIKPLSPLAGLRLQGMTVLP